MNNAPFDQQNDIEKILTKLERVRVMICFGNNSIIGQIQYSSEQRFLDMLNKDLVLGEQRIKNFVVVTQALLINPDGEKEQIPNPCFVSKDSIVFIGTFDETTSTTSENINSFKAYPWREKDVISVTVTLAGKYRLTGQIHNNPGLLPIRSVESKDNFLPMTNVSVISSPEPPEIFFKFAAINKNYISIFQAGS